jgi:hypothetical protein
MTSELTERVGALSVSGGGRNQGICVLVRICVVVSGQQIPQRGGVPQRRKGEADLFGTRKASTIIIIIIIIATKFSVYVLTRRLNSKSAHYKASTKT